VRGTQPKKSSFAGLLLAHGLRDPGTIMRKNRTFSTPLCQEFWNHDG